MSLRWQEVVVVPEVEEDLPCECCRLAARRVEGRLTHNEAPLGRYTVRWRPGTPEHPARHVLYLGSWVARSVHEPPTAAVADFRGGPEGGFSLRDDAATILASLAPWRPRFVRRQDAIGKPLGDALWAMLDAVHVKDPRLAEIRSWTS